MLQWFAKLKLVVVSLNGMGVSVLLVLASVRFSRQIISINNQTNPVPALQQFRIAKMAGEQGGAKMSRAV